MDQWCIVDPANCDSKHRAVGYTTDSNDYFSYEVCDANFAGNSWVGFCKNCEPQFELTSFCTCGGTDSCPCVKAAPQKTASETSVSFVSLSGRSYGSGCKAHDEGLGSCSGKLDTAFGQPNDWCMDQWCIVDPANCDSKHRAVSYTTDSNDYFSYEVCDSNFAGNSWVGFCKNCESPFELTSFCTGDCETSIPTTGAPTDACVKISRTLAESTKAKRCV